MRQLSQTPRDGIAECEELILFEEVLVDQTFASSQVENDEAQSCLFHLYYFYSLLLSLAATTDATAAA